MEAQEKIIQTYEKADGTVPFGDRIIILLCGGDKSRQEQDIADAKKYWADYGRRDDA